MPLIDEAALSELPDVCFSPSWLADQDFDDQFWTSGIGSGEEWHISGGKNLSGSLG